MNNLLVSGWKNIKMLFAKKQLMQVSAVILAGGEFWSSLASYLHGVEQQ